MYVQYFQSVRVKKEYIYIYGRPCVKKEEGLSLFVFFLSFKFALVLS